MSSEPMFNIQERVPLWLAGVFIAIFTITTYGPAVVRGLLYNAALLVPFDLDGVSVPRQLFSLVGHGFLHGSWTHVLVNSGMMVAFAVITMRGVRALRHDHGRGPNPNLVFILIMLLGIIGGGLFQWGWWAFMNTAQAAALGASGGGSALFATAAWAMGGRTRLIQYGMGWALLNLIFIVGASILGPIAWPSHIGGFIVGAMLAPYWVKPFSTGFSITR